MKLPAERLRGLPPAQAEQLRRAVRYTETGERLMAGQLLWALSTSAPDHPEVLRWRGVHHSAVGEWAAAAGCLQRANAQRPGDFEVLRLLAVAQNNAGDFSAATQSLQAAQLVAKSAADWLALTLEWDHQGRAEQALVAVNRVLALDPGSAVALLQRARSATALGDAASAAADCRSLIARRQHSARAWFMLVDLKTVPLRAEELAQLQAVAQATPLGSADRLMLDFALGKACEDAGQVDLAFSTLQQANSAARARHPWDATAFSERVRAVQAAFEKPMPTAQDRAQDRGQEQGRDRGEQLGQEIIFLVGLPRSGTTLVEQVLASHSQVEGASELPYLHAVIEEESRRLARPFPTWVGAASREDWTRLGQRYLSLSQRWRVQRHVSTDKLPENWLLAGAALAMLPGARVIDCRRDAVETCWSCFKQLFGPNQVGFTYDFNTLAAYWHDYDRLCQFWAQRHGARFHVQHYERLVAEPEAQIRGLLVACGLQFEVGCLDFHKARRAIRTPSALQVRQPMVKVSTPAARYGSLMDPLRALLRSPAAAPPPDSGQAGLPLGLGG
jgi:tetratricopeptide (TPR) repeat protein